MHLFMQKEPTASKHDELEWSRLSLMLLKLSVTSFSACCYCRDIPRGCSSGPPKRTAAWFWLTESGSILEACGPCAHQESLWLRRGMGRSHDTARATNHCQPTTETRHGQQCRSEFRVLTLARLHRFPSVCCECSLWSALKGKQIDSISKCWVSTWHSVCWMEAKVHTGDRCEGDWSFYSALIS